MDNEPNEEKDEALRELQFMQGLADLVEEFYPDGVDAAEVQRALIWAASKFVPHPAGPMEMMDKLTKTMSQINKPEFPKDGE